MSWAIKQRWNHVLFLNWKVDPSQIQFKVPFPLDLYEGKAVISVVPFFMDQIRFPLTPAIPWISSLWELNLRTYVTSNGIPGIYFLRLDSNHRIGNWIAKNFFKLPYRLNNISAKVIGDRYSVRAHAKDYHLHIEAQIRDEPIIDPFQKWITERYHLFLQHEGRVIRGDAIHEPWKIKKAHLHTLEGNFGRLSGTPLSNEVDSIYYSKKLDVRFSKFIHVR